MKSGLTGKNYTGADIRGWSLLAGRPPRVEWRNGVREVDGEKVLMLGSILWAKTFESGPTYIYDPSKRWRKKRLFDRG